MRRVNRSKESTPKQMLNMAINLEEKYGCAATVQLDAWSFHLTNSNELKYRIWIDISSLGQSHNDLTWQECQDKYFELMGA
jgi:hypothetical protein